MPDPVSRAGPRTNMDKVNFQVTLATYGIGKHTVYEISSRLLTNLLMTDTFDSGNWEIKFSCKDISKPLHIELGFEQELAGLADTREPVYQSPEAKLIVYQINPQLYHIEIDNDANPTTEQLIHAVQIAILHAAESDEKETP